MLWLDLIDILYLIIGFILGYILCCGINKDAMEDECEYECEDCVYRDYYIEEMLNDE